MNRCIFILLLLTCCLPVMKGQTLGPEDKMISIFFGGGSYWIDDEQRISLNEFIFGVENLNEYNVEVHGHTDDIGSREYNLYLSEMRSASVISQLKSLDIGLDMIQKYDFGEDSPVYKNDSWRGRLSNRRVDIILRKVLL